MPVVPALGNILLGAIGRLYIFCNVVAATNVLYMSERLLFVPELKRKALRASTARRNISIGCWSTTKDWPKPATLGSC